MVPKATFVIMIEQRNSLIIVPAGDALVHWDQPCSVDMIHECSARKFLTRAAFEHDGDKGHSISKH